MKRVKLTLFTAVAVILLLAVAGLSSAFADDAVTSDAIAGAWYGNMHFSTHNAVQRIEMAIPAGCAAGDVCGYLKNFPAQCTWELTFDGFSETKYNYHFSDTLDGACPAGSAGFLIPLADGTLYREHAAPLFTGFGIVSQRPSDMK